MLLFWRLGLLVESWQHWSRSCAVGTYSRYVVSYLRGPRAPGREAGPPGGLRRRTPALPAGRGVRSSPWPPARPRRGRRPRPRSRGAPDRQRSLHGGTGATTRATEQAGKSREQRSLSRSGEHRLSRSSPWRAISWPASSPSALPTRFGKAVALLKAAHVEVVDSHLEGGGGRAVVLMGTGAGGVVDTWGERRSETRGNPTNVASVNLANLAMGCSLFQHLPWCSQRHT